MKLPLFLSNEAKRLIVALMNRQPSKRLGAGKADAEEVKQHPWFKSIDWTKAANRELQPTKPPEKKICQSPIRVNLFLDSGKGKDHIQDWSFVGKHQI